MSESLYPVEALEAAEDTGRPSLWQAVRAPTTRGRVRLRTLSNLRWLAIAGQSAALFIVYFGFGYHLPLILCGLAIAASAILNTGLAIRYPRTHRLGTSEATFYLAFDIVQLAILLFLTGGILNPFSLMFLAPVVIAAATLNLGNTLILAALGFASVSLIAIFHKPLPWDGSFALPDMYLAGIWASLVIGIGFTSVYAWRIASETARMSAGLAATQLALSREHRLASLGALATAAAHELGTPLGTIAVVSRELERALPENSSEREDAKLLREQAERCRAILTKLSNPDSAMLGGATERLPLGALLDDIADQYRGEDVAIAIEIATQNRSEPQPQVWRAPELLHGIANIIENASDFAKTKVAIRAAWSPRNLQITVEDDGPGFAPEIFERIGEPYLTSRPGYHAVGDNEMGPSGQLGGHEGMGLGFFIAKTLLEQLGGTVIADNLEKGGARIVARWPRGAIDGEKPPRTAPAG